MAEGIERELAGAAVVAGFPLSPRVLARALGVEERTILEVAERLVAQGRLAEYASGLGPGRGAEDPGPVLRMSLAGHLADALVSEGASPEIVARLLAEAGRRTEAVRVATDGALAADTDRRPGEAAGLAALALELGSREMTRHEEGRLRLILARHRRTRGESEAAAADAAAAVRLLEGVDKVDALGFVAAVADDRQRAREAEVWVAMGEAEAARIGEAAKLGSLLTFHGRQLGRLGFAREADAAMSRGWSLVAEHGSRLQRHLARINRAWMAFDRGEMRAAEMDFARLYDDADELEGPVGRAVHGAYLARVGFAAGRAREAIVYRDEALAVAARHDAAAPAFLAHVATAEGGLWFRRPADALAGADAALRVVEADLDAWENVVRYLRARVLARLERNEEASEETAAALAACPPGVDGERWRLRIRALDLTLAAERRGRWPRRELEELTDRMLQAGWAGAALEVMLASLAAGDGDEDMGVEAAALALRLGLPMAAAEALDAVDGWHLPEAVAVARAVRAVTSHVPETWQDEWQRLGFVAAALGLPEREGEDEAARALQERLDRALTAAGLGPDGTMLSPAQRRARGLVRHRPVVRRVGRAVMAVVGVAAVAVVAAVVAVPRLLPPPPTPPPTTAATTTTLIRDRPLLPPEGGIVGGFGYRGGPDRTGVVDAAGPKAVAGRFWKVAPGGFFGADPVAYGKLLFVPSSTSDLVYALDQATGQVAFEVPLGGRPAAPVVAGQVKSEDAVAVSGLNLMVVATDDGDVYARDALRAAASGIWQVEVPGVVRGAPLLVGEVVVVATDGGVVLGLDARANGSVAWRYPEEGTIGEVVAAPTEADGVVYVADREGSIHLIDGRSGTPLCDSPLEAFGAVVVPPIVDSDTVYVFVEQGQIQAWPAGRCGGVPQGRSSVYPASSVPILLPPAVDGDTLYLLERQRLLALRLDPSTFDPTDPSTQFRWLPYTAESVITTPPVVADGVVYLGTQQGWVRAVDGSTGEELWAVDLGAKVEQAPVVVDGAVFVVTADGNVWALGG